MLGPQLHFLPTCIRGDLAEVDRLLEHQVVRDVIAANRNEALRCAALLGHLNIVNRLLKFPAVIENIAIDDNRAFCMATGNGHLAVVNRLLEFQAVRDNIAVLNNGALRCAAGNGHLAVVNRLLEFPEVQANVAALDNHALKWAADKGHLDVVERLLMVTPESFELVIKQDFPDVYTQIGERRSAKLNAVRALSQWSPAHKDVILPAYPRKAIIGYAFHEHLCGAQVHTDLDSAKVINCPAIEKLMTAGRLKKTPANSEPKRKRISEREVRWVLTDASHFVERKKARIG